MHHRLEESLLNQSQKVGFKQSQHAKGSQRTYSRWLLIVAALVAAVFAYFAIYLTDQDIGELGQHQTQLFWWYRAGKRAYKVPAVKKRVAPIIAPVVAPITENVVNPVQRNVVRPAINQIPRPVREEISKDVHAVESSLQRNVRAPIYRQALETFGDFGIEIFGEALEETIAQELLRQINNQTTAEQLQDIRATIDNHYLKTVTFGDSDLPTTHHYPRTRDLLDLLSVQNLELQSIKYQRSCPALCGIQLVFNGVEMSPVFQTEHQSDATWNTIEMNQPAKKVSLSISQDGAICGMRFINAQQETFVDVSDFGCTGSPQWVTQEIPDGYDILGLFVSANEGQFSKLGFYLYPLSD